MIGHSAELRAYPFHQALILAQHIQCGPIMLMLFHGIHRFNKEQKTKGNL